MHFVRVSLLLTAVSVGSFAAPAGTVGTPDADGAAALAAAGNIDAAAQALSAENLASKDSLAWYHQSALALLGRAEELKISGDIGGAQKVASAALQLLTRGDTRSRATATVADRAQLYVQAAMAYDHFFGDRDSARQYYQLALQLSPNLETANAALRAYAADEVRLKKLQGGN